MCLLAVDRSMVMYLVSGAVFSVSVLAAGLVSVFISVSELSSATVSCQIQSAFCRCFCSILELLSSLFLIRFQKFVSLFLWEYLLKSCFSQRRILIIACTG